jgi:hypothetical protein
MIEQEVESALEGKAWSPEAAALAVTLAERVKALAKGARASTARAPRPALRAPHSSRCPCSLPRRPWLQTC